MDEGSGEQKSELNVRARVTSGNAEKVVRMQLEGLSMKLLLEIKGTHEYELQAGIYSILWPKY